MKRIVKTHFTIYRGVKDKLFYWHAKRCGRIVSDSGEGYATHKGCLKSLNNYIDSIQMGHFTRPE